MLKWVLTVCCFIAPPCFADSSWSIEGAIGGIYNFPITLNIWQDGFLDIKTTARYETRPFKLPPYYVLRVGRWKDCRAWELDFTHHKLYLINHPQGVKQFTITNGYNLFTLNVAWLLKYELIGRFGLGVVIAHPESTINGLKFDEKGGTLNNGGYYVAGPTAMCSLGRRFYLTKLFFLQIEGRLTSSFADVKIAQGNAFAPNIAFHGLIGMGVDL